MPGPPPDVPAAELFQKLQETPRPSEVVNFPRRTATGKPIDTTRIQVLKAEDHDKARIRAVQRVKAEHKVTEDDLKHPMVDAVVRDYAAREVLQMACLSEKSHGEHGGKPFFPLVFRDAKDIGEMLSGEEVAVLFQAYLLVQAKYGPFERNVQTEQDLSDWIKRLVEGAREYPLQHLSSAHWAELASFLARRAHTLSVILECLLPSLPPTLKSRLASFSLGTGFFGKPPASTPKTGSETSQGSGEEPERDAREMLRLSGAPITVEEAAAMAGRLKEAEAGVNAVLDEIEQTREVW